MGSLANIAGMCAGKTLDQQIQRTFHLSRVALSGLVLGFMCELFFWFESNYQKFCSISVLSTLMGYLPDRNQREMTETERKLVALELAQPLKIRGSPWMHTKMGEAFPQKWSSCCPVHSDPQRGTR